MEYPSAERLPGTEEEKTEFYKKDKGSAGIHGQNFEYKFCALVFIRAINRGYKFKLASNVEGFGAFDDVVMEYLDATSRKSHIFLQLKSKATKHITKKPKHIKKEPKHITKEPKQITEELKHITMKQLLSEKGDFSLRKYYKSYIQIEDKFKSSEEGVKIDGRIEDSLFIIYTNANVGQELKCSKGTEVGEKEFLMTGGSVLQFDEEEHKAIYEHLQELPKHREFLSRFRIFYCQSDEKNMDCNIKPELQQRMKLAKSELEIGYISFLDFMKDWWQNCKFFLKETNCKENDPLRKTSEKVRTTLVAKILDQRKCELENLRIEYKESAITDMKQLIQPHKAVLVFAPGRYTTLTAAKIHQMLSATEHIILKSKQLVLYRSDVVFAWKNGLNVLVLEGDSTAENFQDVFNEIYTILNKHGAEKKFIFISSTMGSIQQRKAFELEFNKSFKTEYDGWKFTDIVPESRKFILEKEISFQGAEVKLSKILNESYIGTLNALASDSIYLLLKDKKPSVGIATEKAVEYYIDRTLQCRKDVPIQGQIQHVLNRDILQESQDIRSHREKNLKREIPKGWKPRTLLDGEERVILVVDEPGMGKSTLLTHLAKQTRESHLETWMVRVNLNNCTRTLAEMKKNGYDENGAAKLLQEAAQKKATDILRLEEQLFIHTYRDTGNMTVLIDGVDEVIPHYRKEVINVLKILSRSEIKKIWVTSRYSMKGLLELELELQCQSYSLVPFSEEDQKSFLVKVWNKKRLAVPSDHLENLANQVVELSMKHLSVGDKHFMGLPLESMVLAEMFEENLKGCSTSASVELPDYINPVILYDSYVEKKWDIYIREKLLCDKTNVNLLTANTVLQQHFIRDHQAAALVAILPTHYFEKLTDVTIVKNTRELVQKIDEGLEKTGIITDVVEGRPVFQHRNLAEYFVARWLCDNIRVSQIFMRDHIFKSGFSALRNMVDRILAHKRPLHEAVLNLNVRYVEEMLREKESLSDKDHGERTPLHVAVSCRSPELIRLLLEHGADISSVDTLLGLSPVDYANRMEDREILSLMMEK